MKNSKALFVTESAIIAALYVTLTWVSNIVGLSYGSIQFRISEVLTILPVFTPAAIPGLTVGCIIANFNSPYGLLDVALGSLATLVASTLCYKLRNKRTHGLPVLSALMPVWANALAVSLVICPFFSEIESGALMAFAVSCVQVGFGELVTGTFLGLLLFKTLVKNNFNKAISNFTNI